MKTVLRISREIIFNQIIFFFFSIYQIRFESYAENRFFFSSYIIIGEPCLIKIPCLHEIYFNVFFYIYTNRNNAKYIRMRHRMHI